MVTVALSCVDVISVAVEGRSFRAAFVLPEKLTLLLRRDELLLLLFLELIDADVDGLVVLEGVTGVTWYNNVSVTSRESAVVVGVNDSRILDVIWLHRARCLRLLFVRTLFTYFVLLASEMKTDLHQSLCFMLSSSNLVNF